MPIFAALVLTICPPGPRDNCIVDGDTLWLGGEKMRLVDVDTPEMRGACPAERALARRARLKLAEHLASGDVTIQRRGQDSYGRTLVLISVDGRSVGDLLVADDLARPWTGHRDPWCS